MLPSSSSSHFIFIIIISSDSQRGPWTPERFMNHPCRPNVHSIWELGCVLIISEPQGLLRTAELGPELAFCCQAFPLTMASGGTQGEVFTRFRKLYSQCPYLEFPLTWISPSFFSEENPSMTSLKHWISCYIKFKKIPIWFLKNSSYQKYK